MCPLTTFILKETDMKQNALLKKREKKDGIDYRRTYAYRVRMVREKTIKYSSEPLNNQMIAAEVIRNTINSLGQNDREHFVVLMLNCKNEIVGTNIASVGSVTRTSIYPTEAFKPAILMSAPAIIFGHNHPSGNVKPSEEDQKLTRKFIAVSSLLRIELLDHVIVSTEDDSYYSFSQTGEMKKLATKARYAVYELFGS